MEDFYKVRNTREIRHRDRGQVDLSSNPAKPTVFFCKICAWKEQKVPSLLLLESYNFSALLAQSHWKYL